MNRTLLFIIATLLLTSLPTFAAGDAKRSSSTVVLDETGVKNLRIESVEVEETDFEEIIFALGRIKVAPGHRGVVSSRVPGRVLTLDAHIDTVVAKDAVVAVLESRQPGDPPPSVRLTAPIGGLVSVVNVAVGQPVENSTSLIEIIDLSAVHAVAAVPEHLAGKLRVGQKAHLRVAAAPEQTFEATLEHLGAEADSESGTLEAAFHVGNAELLLRPGMRAEFSIVLSTREGVMSVPRAALQGDAANRFVYVEDFDLPHAFIKTPVVVGQMNDRFVEITNGLLPGDKVVRQGAYSLAFAGGGSVSLKDALDAAHGHEHAADGGELKPEDQAKKVPGDDGHGHGEGTHASPLWKIVSGVLFVLLIVSTVTKRSSQSPAQSPAAKTEEAQP